MQFELRVSYRQIAVFVAGLDNPFNDWTPIHSAQGFAWRPGSVSFAPSSATAKYTVNIAISDTVSIDSTSIRAIRVPFEVKKGQAVEVASIDDGQVLKLKSGAYALLFEDHSQGSNHACRLTFVRNGDPNPEVVVKDKALKPKYPLLMSATAA
jgi:Competence protein J (ComJ)